MNALTTNIAPKFESHIPSLDGLRGLSILLVIIGHAASTHMAPAFLDRPMITSLGNVGVRLFFLISGFLITTLLLRDIDGYGQVRLKVFYLRRVFRIFPAVYTYILIMWLLYSYAIVDLTFQLGSQTHASSALSSLLYALTFTQNYNHDYNWYFNHLWSLAVEEQFYLLWPFAIFAMGPSRVLVIAIVVVCTAPLIRLAMSALGPQYEIALSREFQAVADSLAMGCILALVHNRICSFDKYRYWLRVAGVPLAILMLAIGYGLAFKSKILALVIGASFSNLGMLIFLHYVVVHPDSVLGRLCNWRPIAMLGLISYSLYLWQQPFLYFRCTSWACSFPQNILLALLCAMLSYWLVERSFLTIKERMTKRISS